jgi:threonine/homoserine/homoserine lactone efflux protein
MNPDLLMPLLGYAFVTSITPGPNNMMLLASGVNFGVRRTMPHMMGVCLGFTLMLVLVGLGMGAVIQSVPWIHLVLKLGSGAFLIWLAWALASSGSMGGSEAGARPMRFIEAVLFQWINPKAWVMAVSAMSIYTDPQAMFMSVLVVSGLFGLVNMPSIAVWVGFGVGLRGFLEDQTRLRLFNISMALLLLLSTVPLLIDAL